MIRYRCPACDAAHECPDSLGGTKGPCPSCGQRLQFPFPRPEEVRQTRPGTSDEPEKVNVSAEAGRRAVKNYRISTWLIVLGSVLLGLLSFGSAALMVARWAGLDHLPGDEGAPAQRTKIPEGNGEWVTITGVVVTCGATSNVLDAFGGEVAAKVPPDRLGTQAIIKTREGQDRCLFEDGVVPVRDDEVVTIRGIRILDEQAEGREAKKGDIVECKVIERKRSWGVKTRLP